MVTYKITLENGESQTTQTGKDLYCSILDKFNIKYTIEEINGNDIPHSDIRRMESEGVYEEKFGEPNFSSVSDNSFSDSTDSTQYFNEEWNSTSTNPNIKIQYVEDDERMNIIGQNGNDGLHYESKEENILGVNSSLYDDDVYEDGIDERPIKKEVDYNDDEFDY